MHSDNCFRIHTEDRKWEHHYLRQKMQKYSRRWIFVLLVGWIYMNGNSRHIYVSCLSQTRYSDHDPSEDTRFNRSFGIEQNLEFCAVICCSIDISLELFPSMTHRLIITFIFCKYMLYIWAILSITSCDCCHSTPLSLSKCEVIFEFVNSYKFQLKVSRIKLIT